jgi:hypothetical protein
LFYLFESTLGQTVFKGRSLEKRNYYNYGKIIFFFAIIIIWGILIAGYNGQNLIIGLKTAKYYPILLLYFIIAQKNIDQHKLFKYIIFLSLSIACLVFVQYIFWGKIQIFYFYDDSVFHVRGVETVRGLRIPLASSLIYISSVLSFSMFLNSKNKSWLFLFLIFFLHTFFIIKTRVALAGVLMSIFLISYFKNRTYSKKNFGKMFFVTSVLMLLIYTMAFKPPFLMDFNLLKETTEDILNLGETGSLTARFSSLQYYWGQFVENAFLGRGLLSDNWDNNPDLFIKQRYSYHLHDLGLFHIILNFGILGFVFIFYATIIIAKGIIKTNFENEISGYFILGFFMFPTIDLFFLSHHLLFFAIFIGLLEKAAIQTRGGITSNGNSKFAINSDLCKTQQNSLDKPVMI